MGRSNVLFDERLTVPINQVEHVIIGRDHYDGEPCERYINCANPECNKQIIASEKNEAKHLGGCTIKCTKHARNRYIVRHNLTEEQVAQTIEALQS